MESPSCCSQIVNQINTKILCNLNWIKFPKQFEKLNIYPSLNDVF